jgi:alpha-beta hydrolase superfamily lysophospholipase
MKGDAMRAMAVMTSLVLTLLIAGPARGEEAPPGARAFNGLSWTVVRTPPDRRAELPELRRWRNVFLGDVRPFPDRKIPPVFWFADRGVEFGVVFQTRAAPLVMLIAGTGGAFDTQSNRELARALYAAGMHVVGLASPTHPSFIVNGSSSGVPGRPAADAADLYRVMQMVLERIRGRIAIADIHLAGFSLGALNAAWVADLDRRQGKIGFDKVLLLNPPVSLWNSTGLLDAMFDRHVPDTARGQRELFDRIFAQFARVFSRARESPLEGDFLFNAYEQLEPTDAALETLIALTFRLAAMNMIFASDVMSKAGYMVSVDAELQPTTSLSPFIGPLLAKRFSDYFDGIYLPHIQKSEPGFTKDAAIAEASLYPLETFLRGDDRIGVLTNRDEIILAPAELDWLEQVFGPRAILFDEGGHGGNYLRPDVVAAIDAFFRGRP